ncbi:hypothetical protein E2562_002664 [Oryza meyeriana var. granulata]|uniref:Uncharacterized protein n=1 Tax=Oryza meyeriana var. granulata TaxID=110450 RepID=A0A6G1BR57_9ORYZ|nr:hypothetical protein E2562_002664 [Oryza meyeriana var. granulata]
MTARAAVALGLGLAGSGCALGAMVTMMVATGGSRRRNVVHSGGGQIQAAGEVVHGHDLDFGGGDGRIQAV